jgi:4-hydroxybenzoate polyprenyltransferase
MLPGWQGAALAAAEHHALPDLVLMAKIALGALAMRAAGCAYNDIVDRDIDAKVARTANRPVASGAVSVKGALAYIGLLCLVGLGVLLTLTPMAIALGVGSLFLVGAYPFMKRITWWPQAWLGLTFNWGALLAYAAASGGLSWSAGLIYAGGVFWTLGYDTIYALQDIEDDALVGVKSSARRLGDGVRHGVALFYALAMVLAFAGLKASGSGVIGLASSVAYGLHLAWQASSVAPQDGARALALFRSNREAGLILFAVIILGGLAF